MMHYWSYGPGYYSYNSGFNILGFIFQVLFWWLVIMLVIKLFKWARGNNQHHCCENCCGGHQMTETDEETEEVEENSNIEIVKTRYAKGEITKKEFDQLKKDLS